MGFDLDDILSEGGVPSDGLVPTLSDVEPFADLDASVPSLSMFNTEQEVQQQQQAQAAPAAAAAQVQQHFAPSVLPPSPMLGAGVSQHSHQVFGLVTPFPEFVPHAQQLEQQVPSLMQQQYVVRGDMVAALPHMTGMIPSMSMVPAPQHTMLMSPQHSAQHQQQQQRHQAAAPVRLSSNGGVAPAFTLGHNNHATGPIRIVRYGDAAGETLSRAERVARYREKRKNRRFEKTIR